MNLVLDVIRDLVNGSKHFQLNPKSVQKRRVDEIHTGYEVGFYDYFFHEDLPGVTVEKFWYFSIRSLKNLVIPLDVLNGFLIIQLQQNNSQRN